MKRLCNLITRFTLFLIYCCSLAFAQSSLAMQVSAGSLLKIEKFPSKFVQPKDVFIWLPDHYNTQTKFSVIYMHDGQSLFDATTTWNKQEWRVDEVAAELMKSGKTKDFIVVSSTNGDYFGENRRANEYLPQGAIKYLTEQQQQTLLNTKRNGGQPFFADVGIQSDRYLKFLTQELKPYIDNTFSVHNNAANTAVMGSSMGGLISFYALAEYPDVFGSAACLSTHWPGAVPYKGNPLPKAFEAYLRDNLPKPGKTSASHRIYFSLGTETLDQYYPPHQKEIDKLMTELGYAEPHWRTDLFPGDAHNETSWAKRLPVAMTFLFGK